MSGRDRSDKVMVLNGTISLGAADLRSSPIARCVMYKKVPKKFGIAYLKTDGT